MCSKFNLGGVMIRKILKKILFFIVLIYILAAGLFVYSMVSGPILTNTTGFVDVSNNDVNSTLKKIKIKNMSPKTKPVEIPILVNKENKFPSSYIPDNLVRLPSGRMLNKKATQQYLKMVKDAKNSNVIINEVSAYRSYYTQGITFNNAVARNGLAHTQKFVAQPGTSEHQTGLALDISTPGYKLNSTFLSTAAYKWLKENHIKYGFIMRYKEDKVDTTKYSFEPWHYRYVGIDMAKEIEEKDFCLEEYVEYLKSENKK
jgi:D-alanyl-D-alanine carboxypeptidase